VTQVIIGGLLIGLSSVLLMALQGRIAGISSIVYRAAFVRGSENWTLWFVLGLVVGPAILLATGLATVPALESSWLQILIGGLLVGIGTKLGSGCTSGHGVCGIGRGSLRSILATVAFMASGALAVLAMRWGGLL